MNIHITVFSEFCEDLQKIIEHESGSNTYLQLVLEVRAENQDGGVGRHTVPPRTTRTDRKSNGKGVQHQENTK